jgi:hypothetical protein
VAASFAFLLALPAAFAVGGTEYDGTYMGTMACDEMPGMFGALKVELELKVTNGRAQYEREVQRPTGGGGQGITERGSGTVSSSGDLTLSGSAAGPGWSYQASYRGQFSGKSLRLAGAQTWQLRTGGSRTRQCTITVAGS